MDFKLFLKIDGVECEITDFLNQILSSDSYWELECFASGFREGIKSKNEK